MPANQTADRAEMWTRCTAQVTGDHSEAEPANTSRATCIIRTTHPSSDWFSNMRAKHLPLLARRAAGAKTLIAFHAKNSLHACSAALGAAASISLGRRGNQPLPHVIRHVVVVEVADVASDNLRHKAWSVAVRLAGQPSCHLHCAHILLTHRMAADSKSERFKFAVDLVVVIRYQSVRNLRRLANLVIGMSAFGGLHGGLFRTIATPFCRILSSCHKHLSAQGANKAIITANFRFPSSYLDYQRAS